jgi:hypothetical protein
VRPPAAALGRSSCLASGIAVGEPSYCRLGSRARGCPGCQLGDITRTTPGKRISPGGGSGGLGGSPGSVAGTAATNTVSGVPGSLHLLFGCLPFRKPLGQDNRVFTSLIFEEVPNGGHARAREQHALAPAPVADWEDVSLQVDSPSSPQAEVMEHRENILALPQPFIFCHVFLSFVPPTKREAIIPAPIRVENKRQNPTCLVHDPAAVCPRLKR